MKNQIIGLMMFVAAMTFGLSARASILTWQMNSAPSGIDAGSYKAARLMLYNSNSGTSTALAQWDNDNEANYTGNGAELTAANADGSVGESWNNVSSYTGSQYSFYVELVNYTAADGINGGIYTAVADSAKVSYQDLVTAGAISSSSISTENGLNSYNFSQQNFSAVPEPTSGLLILLGVSVLALRRRRQA